MMNIQSIDWKELLKGRYEAECMPKDFSQDRMASYFAYNVMNPLGLLYRPVVDEHLLAQGGDKPSWPDGKRFAVCLTHDVDRVSLYSSKQSFRWLRSQSPSRNSEFLRVVMRFGAKLFRAVRNRLRRDPLHRYEDWLKVESDVGAISTFFFWPGWSNVSRHHVTDCSYELHDRVVFDDQDCSVAEIIQEIHRRGWEIGLHPSWNSFDDVNELLRQKEALEKVLGQEIVSVRQHFLNYDIRITPRVHSEANLKYNSTLGLTTTWVFALALVIHGSYMT